MDGNPKHASTAIIESVVGNFVLWQEVETVYVTENQDDVGRDDLFNFGELSAGETIIGTVDVTSVKYKRMVSLYF